MDFSDNAEVLGLIESRMGIIAVLNEECVRPRGGDLSFVNKVTVFRNEIRFLFVLHFLWRVKSQDGNKGIVVLNFGAASRIAGPNSVPF